MSDTLTGVTEITTVIRDVALISIMLAVMFVLLLLFKKISAILDSARRTMKIVEEITTALSGGIVGPASAGSSVAFGAGKLAAFVLGFSRSKKQKGKGEKDSGR